ncbi:MAG: DUF6318 family protein [Actinomyces sp.]|nr:DUF6318 family protein [Actinomyces sp.]
MACSLWLHAATGKVATRAAALKALNPTAAHTKRRKAYPFAEYYLNLLAYSINTGNTTTLKKVSSPECKLCQMYLDKIPDFYSKGYWADRMEHKFSQINEAIPHPEIEGLYFVKMRVTTSPYLEFKDGTVHSIAEVDENVELEVQRNHSSFVIKSFFAEGVGDEEEAQS